MFQNRKLIIATKHLKERVIAPLLEKELGLICFTDQDFDTDTLGTFSGEVERQNDPLSTAREKCLLAMKKNNCDLGLASEGSFGAHPSIFFASADDEFLIFIDKKNNLEIIARELSLSTNFNGKEVYSENELMEFAKGANFPTHALILRKSKNDILDIFKGITETEQLINTYRDLSTKYHTVFVETDMRAMFNPTRMAVIEKATEKLLQKIKSVCPKCDMPGFDIKEAKKGLPCSLCGLPTKATLSYTYVCQHCAFLKEVKYPLNRTTEDPAYCDFCNP